MAGRVKVGRAMEVRALTAIHPAAKDREEQRQKARHERTEP